MRSLALALALPVLVGCTSDQPADGGSPQDTAASPDGESAPRDGTADEAPPPDEDPGGGGHPVGFEEATDSPFSEELSRQEHTVDGRDAVAIERRFAGAGLIPQGERSYTYVVDLGRGASDHEHGMILVAATTTVGDTDYELDRRVLDRMMETVTIDVHDEA